MAHSRDVARLPPLDQRSCCHIPTMFSRLVGLTSIQGSTSLFRNTSPDWPGTSSAVHAANGLVPETWTRGPAVKSIAAAGWTARKPSPRSSRRSRAAVAEIVSRLPLRLRYPIAVPLNASTRLSISRVLLLACGANRRSRFESCRGHANRQGESSAGRSEKRIGPPLCLSYYNQGALLREGSPWSPLPLSLRSCPSTGSG